MKTVLQIIEEAGGLIRAECITVENKKWMSLVIKVLSEREQNRHVYIHIKVEHRVRI